MLSFFFNIFILNSYFNNIYLAFYKMSNYFLVLEFAFFKKCFLHNLKE